MAGESDTWAPVEERTFSFASEQDPYGFINVGAKVCQVVPGTQAETLRVQPGWYLAGVDGDSLPGALTSSLCRRVPAVTTEQVWRLLLAKRTSALIRQGTLRLTFFTNPLPLFREPVKEVPVLQASSVDEFRQALIKKYGSLVKAWKELDEDSSNTLTYNEFLLACRKVGFKGSMRQAFNELDADRSGVVGLTELDPTADMDCTIGRCYVCGLPNPCYHHGEADQKRWKLHRHLEKERLARNNRLTAAVAQAGRVASQVVRESSRLLSKDRSRDPAGHGRGGLFKCCRRRRSQPEQPLAEEEASAVSIEQPLAQEEGAPVAKE